MDKVKITPSSLSGEVKIPPSKSYAHRAIIAAFLSGEPCTIKNICLSKDILATLDCIKALGGHAKYSKKTMSLSIKKGMPKLHKRPRLFCFESGSTLRFFIPIALTLFENAKFIGKGRLFKRPLTPYFKIFDKLGIIYKQTSKSLTVNGKLTPGEFSISGSVSSQFITGLLFALPLLDGDSRINILGELSSKAYIDITLDVLSTFGISIENIDYKTFIIKGNQKYSATDYTVEGDFSQAAFFLVAGALGCDVSVSGLNPESLQGDKKIIDVINEVGAKVFCENGIYRASLTPNMKGITIDADEIPDLVPILAVLFAFCKGESRIVNAHRLRLKESDRLFAISDVLKKMGAEIEEGEDFLVIHGREALNGATVSSHNDHRIAMAASIAACRCEGAVTIMGAKKSVKKSYPDFFEDYKKLGGLVE